VSRNGTFRSWGDNSYGSLGDGARTHRSTPVRVRGPSDVVDIEAPVHSLAIQNTVFTVKN
jgi:regulator of chromosome condensation (RCC1) repeat-containing protein